MEHQPPKAEVGCSNHLGCANHVNGLVGSPALLERLLPALYPRNVFAGRSREKPPENERAGSGAIGTGSKLDKQHRANPKTDEPAGRVNADDWSSYAADPLATRLVSGSRQAANDLRAPR